ncbi:UDP-N-acetylmuramate dehydrogenase [Candidatus Peregrinibacteria bacterium]|nr:UDP-N-acetylmuramate dehydrogenase [Candidatus Peregrinibacteria bacterium]
MELAIKQNVVLGNYTTYGIGGSALFFSEARSGEEMYYLREFAKKKGILFFMLGLGSNVLFADEGFQGLVVYNQMLKMHFQGPIVTVESGVPLTQLIHAAAKLNLSGFEELAGIPGSIGGAIYGNAGVPGCELQDRLMHSMILEEQNSFPTIVQPQYFQFAYRSSVLKGRKDIVLAATFKLEPQPQVQAQRRINEVIKSRVLKQPSGKSCGSFFKNPGEFPSAGWLIEQVGCKGMREGGAIVSQKHANWILNTDNATTKDIVTLAKKIQEKVFKKFRVVLEPEVQIVPFNPFKK